MYEELIKSLRCHQSKEGKPCLSCSCKQQFFCDNRHDTEAAYALEALINRLSALQAENAELREENGCLQHNVAAMQATLDQQAKNCETLIAEKDKELARAEAERDAAVADLNIPQDCRTCGNKTSWCDNPDSCKGYKWRGAQGEG